MDWIQWYLAVALSLSLVGNLLLEGKAKRDTYWSCKIWILNILLGLPYIGRVFGWW